MQDLAIAVRLKAPDPAAITALATLKRLKPEMCPLELHRFHHWLFLQPEGGRDTVEEIVSHFHDIVNPNKQIWHFTEDPIHTHSCDGNTTVSEVLVTDIVDSISENWTDILLRRNFAVAGVVYSVLWRFVFPSGVTPQKAQEWTRLLTCSSHRDGGLLANPVSQKIELLDQA